MTIKATVEIGEAKASFEAEGTWGDVYTAFKTWLVGVEKMPIKIDIVPQTEKK